MRRFILLFLFFVALGSVGLAQSGVPLTFQEADGSPKKTMPSKFIVPNNTLSVSGSTVTFSLASLGLGTVTHTGALTLNQLVIGNGSADIKTFAFGTGNQYLGMNSGATALEWKTLSITNADVNAAAAIAYSKLNLAGSVVNADIGNSAAIAYSKLNLTGAIVNNDLAGSIAQSKITNLTTDLVAKAPLASPVFTGQPTIPDFTLSTHTHQNNAGGGTLNASAIAAGTLASARGGTGSAFFAISGPTALRTYALPDANATIARTDAAQTFTGNQTFGSPLLLPDGDATSPALARSAQTGTGLYFGNEFIVFTAANTPKFFFEKGSQNQFVLGADVKIGWASTSSAIGGAADGAIGRTAPRVISAFDRADSSGVANAGWFTDAGIKRVTTQFDKTSSTALANITGLSVNVEAGRTYSFEVVLYTTSNSGGGVQAAIAGTATATSIIYEAIVDSGGALNTIGTSRATALGAKVGDVTAVTVARCRISGTITVNAAGTLTVQFAQNASNGSASSVLVGSSFIVRDNP